MGNTVARHGRTSWLAAAFLGCSLLILAGCAGKMTSTESGSSGGDGGGAPAGVAVAGKYQVQRGDTLYSVARRYNQDWKALAVRNGIQPPYAIQTGQWLDVGVPPAQTAAPLAAPVQAPLPQVQPYSPPAGMPASSTPASGSSLSMPTAPPISGTGMPATPLPVGSAAPAGLGLPQNIPPAVAPAVSAPAVSSTPAIPSVPSAPVSVVPEVTLGPVRSWRWPTHGRVVRGFAPTARDNPNKGIDIAGQVGQPVTAAAAGKVVYAGSALQGYGQLLLIKHNETYVTAYGHNRKLLVQEGQSVRAGEPIAEMGSSGTDRVKLHFEIRRDGKAVDPMQLLPRS